MPTMKEVKVDKEDEYILTKFKWEIKKCRNYYYVYRRGSSKSSSRSLIGLHREILGVECVGKIVDHINQNPLDNRRCNLRVVTVSQNAMNQRKQEGRSSKYKGVHFDKAHNKFRASIKYKGVKKHLGRFKTEEEAALAYNKAALELFGEYAKLNEVV